VYDIELAEDFLGLEKTLIHGGAHPVHHLYEAFRFIEIYSLVMNSIDLVIGIEIATPGEYMNLMASFSQGFG